MYHISQDGVLGPDALGSSLHESRFLCKTDTFSNPERILKISDNVNHTFHGSNNSRIKSIQCPELKVDGHRKLGYILSH
jgi:hypothetical protein